MSSVAINQDKIKKVLIWLSETLQNNPDKNRTDVLREAEIRFDLSPKECEFLDSNFSNQIDSSCS